MTAITQHLEKLRKEVAEGAPHAESQYGLQFGEEALQEHRFCIVAGKRIPTRRAERGKNGDTPAYFESSAEELSHAAVGGLLERAGIDPREVDQFGIGCAVPPRDLTNLAGVVETQLGMKNFSKPSLAIDRRANCITSAVLLKSVIQEMLLWGGKVGIVAGVEKLSSASLVIDAEWERLIQRAFQEKDFTWRENLLKLPFGNVPIRKFTDKNAITQLNMGVHCEMMAQQYGISKLEQAQFAVGSHRKAAIAKARGLFDDLIPFNGVTEDNLLRADTDVESIMKLRPSFPIPGVDNPTINAGTSTALCDGAAALAVMSEEEAERRDLKPLAFLKGMQEAKVEDYNRDGLLMAPAVAVPTLLSNHALTLDDIDVFQFHTPFAAQFFCLQQEVGEIPLEKLNPYGDGLSLGHAFAASSARDVELLAIGMNEVKEKQSLDRPVLGLYTSCANEGEGIALLFSTN